MKGRQCGTKVVSTGLCEQPTDTTLISKLKKLWKGISAGDNDSVQLLPQPRTSNRRPTRGRQNSWVTSCSGCVANLGSSVGHDRSLCRNTTTEGVIDAITPSAKAWDITPAKSVAGPTTQHHGALEREAQGMITSTSSLTSSPSILSYKHHGKCSRCSPIEQQMLHGKVSQHPCDSSTYSQESLVNIETERSLARTRSRYFEQSPSSESDIAVQTTKESQKQRSVPSRKASTCASPEVGKNWEELGSPGYELVTFPSNRTNTSGGGTKSLQSFVATVVGAIEGSCLGLRGSAHGRQNELADNLVEDAYLCNLGCSIPAYRVISSGDDSNNLSAALHEAMNLPLSENLPISISSPSTSTSMTLDHFSLIGLDLNHSISSGSLIYSSDMFHNPDMSQRIRKISIERDSELPSTNRKHLSPEVASDGFNPPKDSSSIDREYLNTEIPSVESRITAQSFPLCGRGISNLPPTPCLSENTFSWPNSSSTDLAHPHTKGAITTLSNQILSDWSLPSAEFGCLPTICRRHSNTTPRLFASSSVKSKCADSSTLLASQQRVVPQNTKLHLRGGGEDDNSHNGKKLLDTKLSPLDCYIIGSWGYGATWKDFALQTEKGLKKSREIEARQSAERAKNAQEKKEKKEQKKKDKEAQGKGLGKWAQGYFLKEKEAAEAQNVNGGI